jgi:hypothetical protein
MSDAAGGGGEACPKSLSRSREVGRPEEEEAVTAEEGPDSDGGGGGETTS